MNYEQVLEYLFSALPMYQRVGNVAFKKDLTNTIALSEALGNPHEGLKTIHVAGTNGKGSSSHMLAAALQSAGYRVGLYTSPHLKDFTERIRINGKPMRQSDVIRFVEVNKAHLEKIKPSFFEMTVVMAFDHFTREKVDIAVIEVGLGGRLDSTNIIHPEVSLITNIGFDHMDMLGNTLPLIAGEKAGIIKNGVPVIISEFHSETLPVFEKVAESKSAPLIQAWHSHVALPSLQLLGKHQLKNARGVVATLQVLRQKGWEIQDKNVVDGLQHVCELTGLKGRWHCLSQYPLTFCDTGHNQDAFEYILNHISTYAYRKLYMVLGFVKEKDLSKLFPILPQDAVYVFCAPKIPRAMSLATLKEELVNFKAEHHFVEDVSTAIEWARARAHSDDFIFIGGSTFVVAEIEDL